MDWLPYVGIGLAALFALKQTLRLKKTERLLAHACQRETRLASDLTRAKDLLLRVTEGPKGMVLLDIVAFLRPNGKKNGRTHATAPEPQAPVLSRHRDHGPERR